MKKKKTNSTIKVNLNDCVDITLGTNYQDYVAAIDRIRKLEIEVKRIKKRTWKKRF